MSETSDAPGNRGTGSRRNAAASRVMSARRYSPLISPGPARAASARSARARCRCRHAHAEIGPLIQPASPQGASSSEATPSLAAAAAIRRADRGGVQPPIRGRRRRLPRPTDWCRECAEPLLQVEAGEGFPLLRKALVREHGRTIGIIEAMAAVSTLASRAPNLLADSEQGISLAVDIEKDMG